MITINMNIAKEVAHEKRRASRNVEFAPYDEIISKQIPGSDSANAEQSRVEIRTKYETIQNNINTVSGISELKTIMDELINE
jgi:hypothetical protein